MKSIKSMLILIIKKCVISIFELFSAVDNKIKTPSFFFISHPKLFRYFCVKCDIIQNIKYINFRCVVMSRVPNWLNYGLIYAVN